MITECWLVEKSLNFPSFKLLTCVTICLPIYLLHVQQSKASDRPCFQPKYQHGVANLLSPKYGKFFRHFEYANPKAPKGGSMRVPQLGTFDNYNSIVEKGRLAAGYEVTGGLVYDSLLEKAIDEPVSYYGRLAEGVAVAPNKEWIAFKLRSEATWHDGRPITTADVLFTFKMLKTFGSVAIKTALADLQDVFAVGDSEICFVRDIAAELNPSLPFIIGEFSILPKHYWLDKDISKTSIYPPLGSGPYRLFEANLGRKVRYERVVDYWGANLPVNKGRYNFDTVEFDYFKDETVMAEAHRSGEFDVREEGVSKAWAKQYDFPAVKAGIFKKELRPLARVEGLWWPIFWNLEHPPLDDIRIREALWLLFDFEWTNRVIFHSFYEPGVSIFQNSPMAHKGLPSEKELTLLNPWRDQIPPRVFSEEFRHPPSSGFGTNRENLHRALDLFDQAGWEVSDGTMRSKKSGETFKLDIIGASYYSIRQSTSLLQNLEAVGIEVNVSALEVSNWLHRTRTGKFDGNNLRLEPTFTPGLQLRNWFGSAAADADYGQNWLRLRSPVIDSLIDSVITADSAENLFTATRALDRIIMWNFYLIPLGSQPGFRLVYWDKFGEVPGQHLSRVPFIDAWWWDESKAERVARGLASLMESP